MIKQAILDPRESMNCAHAVQAAYAEHNAKHWSPPAGYKHIATVTGWSTVYILRSQAMFGLIFDSLSNPGELIIAFRGTQLMSEWHHDLWSIPTLFTPFRPKNPLSKEIYVAGGFYGLYSDQGPSGQPSMREQFFSVFDSLPKLQKIETSGHSLGSSFSSLCALDLKAAYPKADIKNTNFASPAVGTENWEDVYNNELGLKSSTFRIYNYWDYVPSMPPLPIFKHVGQPFEINTFVKDSWFPDLVARHSMDNYAYILGKAVKNSPQVWVGDYPDQTDPALTMKSQAPYGVTPPNWAALEIEMKENLPYSKS